MSRNTKKNKNRTKFIENNCRVCEIISSGICNVCDYSINKCVDKVLQYAICDGYIYYKDLCKVVCCSNTYIYKSFSQDEQIKNFIKSIKSKQPTNESLIMVDGKYHVDNINKDGSEIVCSSPALCGWMCILKSHFKVPKGVVSGVSKKAWQCFVNNVIKTNINYYYIDIGKFNIRFGLGSGEADVLKCDGTFRSDKHKRHIHINEKHIQLIYQ